MVKIIPTEGLHKIKSKIFDISYIHMIDHIFTIIDYSTTPVHDIVEFCCCCCCCFVLFCKQCPRTLMRTHVFFTSKTQLGVTIVIIITVTIVINADSAICPQPIPPLWPQGRRRVPSVLHQSSTINRAYTGKCEKDEGVLVVLDPPGSCRGSSHHSYLDFFVYRCAGVVIITISFLSSFSPLSLELATTEQPVPRATMRTIYSGPARHNSMLQSLSSSPLLLFSMPDRLVGLGVKASQSKMEDPGFDPAGAGSFSGPSHTSD